jgi:hypothetical protein
MIDLYHNATHQLLGALTEAELQVLIEGLEEESLEDRDYYIDAATIDLLADGRATDHLVQLLRTALGGRRGRDPLAATLAYGVSCLTRRYLACRPLKLAIVAHLEMPRGASPSNSVSCSADPSLSSGGGPRKRQRFLEEFFHVACERESPSFVFAVLASSFGKSSCH